MAALDRVCVFCPLVTSVIDVLLFQPIDFTCVETQIGNGDPLDCEIIEFDGQEGYYKIQVPPATERSVVEAKV